MPSCPSGKDIFTTPENTAFYCRRRYISLDAAKQEIRLLRVHPERLTADNLASVFPEWLEGDTDAAKLVQDINKNGAIPPQPFICCQLLEPITIGLRSGKYTALSYCAGSPLKTRRLMIDGYWFNAFANLEHALEGFRANCDKDSWFGNVIWTDQICINQLDIRERSHQVGIMRKIYENAQRTYVVLSTADSRFPDAHKGIEAVGTVLGCKSSSSPCPFSLPLGLVSGFEELCSNDTSLCILDSLYNLPNKLVMSVLPRLLKFMDSLVASEWWTRAWVFQEFVVSKSVYFICQTGSLPFEELEPFLHFYLTYLIYLAGEEHEHAVIWPPHPHPHHSPEMTSVTEALMVSVAQQQRLGFRIRLPLPFTEARRYQAEWVSRPTPQPGFMYQLMMAPRLGFQASDPRDMLYAFCGLSRITSRVIADYSSENTIWDVYTSVAEHLLEASRAARGEDNRPMCSSGEAGLDLLVLSRAVHSKKKKKKKKKNGSLQPARENQLLPSWAPDFGSTEAWPVHHFRFGPQPWGLHDLLGHQRPTHPFVQDASRSRWKILCVDGRRFRRIDQLDLEWREPNGETGLAFTFEDCFFRLYGRVGVGDELWVFQCGVGIYALRRRVRGGHDGYHLVGVGEIKRAHSGDDDPELMDSLSYEEECAFIKQILERGGDDVTEVRRIEIF